MEYLIIILSLLMIFSFGMAIQDKTGIEKLVWNTSTPIELLGQYIAPEDQLEIERILQKSAKGTSSRTGNNRIEHEFDYRNAAIAATIDAEDGNTAPLEIWQLGSSVADETIAGVSINVMNQGVGFDPEAEQSSPVRLKIYVVYNS